MILKLRFYDYSDAHTLLRNHNCCSSRKYQIKKADNQEHRQIKAEMAIDRSDRQAEFSGNYSKSSGSLY